MEFNISRHLAAISPYSRIHHNPAIPSSKKVDSAVYLFRHGIIHVNGHDFNEGIAPFLQKLRRLQQTKTLPERGKLGFLSTYASWITKDDVGRISETGLLHSREMGMAFRKRYKAWLKQEMPNSKAHMFIWSDSAERCVRSAQAFAKGFTAKHETSSNQTSEHASSILCPTTVETIVIDSDVSEDPCDNLCYHRRFPEIDQTAGQDQADAFLAVYTGPIIERLRSLVDSDLPLEPSDICAMQLLCCYDLVAGKESPFTGLFERTDWLGFEYMRDVKYHYSEGYGAAHAGIYATPWLDAALRLLQQPPTEKAHDKRLPLWIGFTHREEILYLVVLLGIAWQGPKPPRIDRVDEDRHWRVSALAPYLGHLGLESYRTVDRSPHVRFVLNGDVVPAFKGRLKQDMDGGYEVGEVELWVRNRVREWDDLKGGRLTFLDR